VSDKTDFPTPSLMNSRLYFDRHAAEIFKRQIVGLGSVDRDPRQPIVFIDATTVASEFGACRRTTDRMIAPHDAGRQ
jgi:hypothetical protein